MSPEAERSRLSRLAEPVPFRGVAMGSVSLMLAPFAVFATHYGYSLRHLEFWGSAAILAAAGVLAAAVARHRVTAAVLLACLSALFVDVQFTGAADIVVWAVFAAVVVLAQVDGFRTLLGIAAATIAVSTIAGAMVPQAPRASTAKNGSTTYDTDLPFVLHLILDEHVAADTLPDDQAGRGLAEEIGAFYRRHGLTVYPAAYSEYFQSYRSISHALNGAATAYDPSLFRRADDGFEWTMRRNSYLDSLLTRGYSVRVYQTDHLNLCPQPHDRLVCDTYGITDVGALRDTTVGLVGRVRVIVSSYVTRSDAYNQARQWYWRLSYRLGNMGIPVPAWRWERERTGPITSMTLLRHLAASAPGFGRGQAVIAHVMAPHFPYVYDEQCRLRPVAEWLGRMALGPPLPVANTAADRRVRYERYSAQLRCLYTELEKIMAAVPENVKQDAVLVFHGDHGSRLTLLDPTAPREAILTEQDLFDGFSTLFAVRIPGATPTPPSSAPLALSCLLGALTSAQHQGLDVGRCTVPARVFLPGSPAKFVRFPSRHTD